MPIKNGREIIPEYIRGSVPQLVPLLHGLRDEKLEKYLTAGDYQIVPSRSLPDSMIVYDVRDVPLPSFPVDRNFRTWMMRGGFELTATQPVKVMHIRRGGQFGGGGDRFL